MTRRERAHSGCLASLNWIHRMVGSALCFGPRPLATNMGPASSLCGVRGWQPRSEGFLGLMEAEACLSLQTREL
eukprot:6072867-Amphidinium_carterae.1